MEKVADLLVARGLCASASVARGCIRTDKGDVFVKFGTGGQEAAQGLLEYEAEGLRVTTRIPFSFHQTNGGWIGGQDNEPPFVRMAGATPLLRVPRPWLVGQVTGHGSFIAMDKLQLGYGGGSVQHSLGIGLAAMHKAPSPTPGVFGFPMDGCCGALEQPNNTEQRRMTWVEFWREFRLGHQLRVAKETFPEDVELQHLGEQLCARLPELFSGLVVEDIEASLLHGDLWSGNFASDDQGRPCVFDPACYYGHHEADLGIARMFGGFSSEFWAAYHNAIPKAVGFEKRAKLYELHHHLNHLNIFESGYRSGCVSLMRGLLSR